MSDPFLESILASFDSQTNLLWNLTSPTEATASFTLNADKITVTLAETIPGEWRVSFDVVSSAQFTSEKARSSLRIFSGVFQSVEEFLTIRQPARVAFAAKEEALGRLYETHLARQDTTLGYRTEDAFRAAPLSEYALIKTTPSTWSAPH